MRFPIAICFLATGCASHIRTELVGTGTAVIAPRSAPAGDPPPGAGMPVPRGSYDLAMWFNIPRAQLVEWRVSCPGVERTGRLGESFETYRDRRLDQLRSEQERERDRRRAAFEAAVAAPPPAETRVAPVRTRTRIVTPVGTVVVRGRAAPPPMVEETPPPPPPLPPDDGPLPEPVLAPGDDGHGTLSANVRVDTNAPGECVVIATTDDSNVRATYTVVRIRDLDVEAAEARQAALVRAIDVRTRLRTQLVTFGADATARERRREAEGQARARAEVQAGIAARQRVEIELRASREAELRLAQEVELERRRRWEADAPRRLRLELIASWELRAHTHREWFITWLVGECHADPGRRARIEGERRERERLLLVRIEFERQERLRIRLERERVIELRLEAERAERMRIAVDIRMRLTGYLQQLGAHLRPPRPAPRLETPGASPFDGADWIAGRWEWRSPQWIWIAGGWTDPDRFGHAGGEIAVRAPVVIEEAPVVVARPVVVEPVVTLEPTPVVVVPVGITVRTPAVRITTPSVRVVRDRRPAPVVRDHRDHRHRKEDDRKTVRDHRR
ncbi:MAG: hypothetical protein ABI867_36775 [Kofleriaceae bacterium]